MDEQLKRLVSSVEQLNQPSVLRKDIGILSTEKTTYEIFLFNGQIPALKDTGTGKYYIFPWSILITLLHLKLNPVNSQNNAETNPETQIETYTPS